MAAVYLMALSLKRIVHGLLSWPVWSALGCNYLLTSYDSPLPKALVTSVSRAFYLWRGIVQ